MDFTHHLPKWPTYGPFTKAKSCPVPQLDKEMSLLSGLAIAVNCSDNVDRVGMAISAMLPLIIAVVAILV